MVIRIEEEVSVRSFHGGKTKYAQVGDSTTTFIQIWNLDGNPMIDKLVGQRVRITVELLGALP